MSKKYTLLGLLCGCLCCGGKPPYLPQSEFWSALPQDPTLDPQSAAYIQDLLKGTSQTGLDIATTSYNVPIVRPPSGTARVTVKLAMDSPAHPLGTVPIPDSARPAQGTDGDLVILDTDNNVSYEFWQMQRIGNGWQATEAVTFDLQGDGINHAGSGVRATSLSLLLGLLTYDEVSGGGPIQHAIAWASDRASNQFYTSPAASSDGNQPGGDPASLPEGARLQLDPGLNVGALGLSPAGQRIAEALQLYGMFLVDLSADSTLIAEDLDGTGKSWDGLLSFDEIHKIPASSFRVVKLRDRIAITP